MSTKFTDGPWSAIETKRGRVMTDVKLEDAGRVEDELVSSVQWSPLLDQATALLRKSPELLERIKRLDEQNHILIELMRERIL